MSPPFRTKGQGCLFSALILVLALTPWLPKPSWLDRGQLYREIVAERGSYAYFSDHVLRESTDIDVAFLGNSGLEADIDPGLVRAALRPYLDHDPVVEVIGHLGEDPAYDYAALVDVLRRRRIKTLFLHRNRTSKFVFDLVRDPSRCIWDLNTHFDVLEKLTFSQLTATYFAGLDCAGHLLTSPFSDVRPAVGRLLCQNQARLHGACLRWQDRRHLGGDLPPPPALPLASVVHLRRANDPLLAEGRPYSRDDRIFSDEIFRVCAQNHIKIAMIQVPYDLAGDLPRDRIEVPRMASDQPGFAAPIIGATLEGLFPGLSNEAILRRYYFDPYGNHMHYAAADYWTSAVLPGIVAVFRGNVAPAPAASE